MTPTDHTPDHTPDRMHTAANTRRPWYRRSAYRAAAAVLTGGALAIADTLHGMTHESAFDKFAAAAAMLAAFGLMARGCLEVRPCYRRPETTAADMSD
jgi:hypothetical protein